MARKAKAPRTGVHVEATSPALYRDLLRIAIPYVATRAADGSLTIHDESRWACVLGACEAKEI
jgi:hypothetical protein